MPRGTDPVLVDTNVVIECHRISAWRALARGYRIETVTQCVQETQAGARRRHPQRVNRKHLVEQLTAVHSVTNRELAELVLRTPGLELDEGERALWAHAIGRNDDWRLCGPDAASLRAGVRLGFRERLTSLERLLVGLGFRCPKPLRAHYTEKWHRRKLNEIVVLGER